jgi:hypothetical protein
LIIKGGNIEDLPMWAQVHIRRQDKDIENLKKALGKIYSYNENINQVFAKLNVGARSDKD